VPTLLSSPGELRDTREESGGGFNPRHVSSAWFIAACAFALSILVYTALVSSRAGALEQRVTTMETRQDRGDLERASVMGQLDTVDSKLSRIEGMLEAQRDQASFNRK
jgi:hypothetical protein